MDIDLKKQVWVIEKEHVAWLDQEISKFQNDRWEALNAGENFRACEIKFRIADFKKLRSNALNVLRLLPK